MKGAPGYIVAVKRNPIYDNSNVRDSATRDVLYFVHKYVRYDTDGIKEYLLPWRHDNPHSFYCSEMLNYFSLLHSDGKTNLRGDGSNDDDVTPHGIQTCGFLRDVTMFAGVYQLQSMDYILTTSSQLISRAIRAFGAGFKNRKNPLIASHCGIVVVIGGLYWVAEMIGDGSVLSGIHKYKTLDSVMRVRQLSGITDTKRPLFDNVD
jgi:hypothetical protein